MTTPRQIIRFNLEIIKAKKITLKIMKDLVNTKDYLVYFINDIINELLFSFHKFNNYLFIKFYFKFLFIF